MSQQKRPVETFLTVCDLCNKAIPDYDGSPRKSSLVHGYGGYPDKAKARAWYLLWDPRNWSGRSGPTWEEQRANPKRWGYRHYDFHTECLIDLVESHIEDSKGD